MTDSIAARLTTALDGRYLIDRELGAGGMATVYLATDVRHDRQVAIKVLHEDLGATLGTERFLAEIKTTARLQHPHILPLLDSGAAGGLLFYVMPYVEGESLRQRLERERQLPLDVALRIAREVGDALGAAHAHGIIHRDIKPENILLQGEHALVADFGIALAVQHAGGARLTQTGLSLGTPQYMAPEQAMGEKTVDARADLYALGAVTYEMLTGEPPFTGATVQAIVAKVLGSEPAPPTAIRRTIPAHVEDAVLAALAKLPADRQPNVAAFVAALGDGSAAPVSGGRTAVRRAVPNTAATARAWAVAGLTVGVFAGVAAGWYAWRGRSGAAAVTRVYVRQPVAEALPHGTADFAMSPTGADLVYVGPGDAAGTFQLWRKRRDDLHAGRIAGTTGGYAPFFSPDGRWVAYSTREGLYKVALDGGQPTQVAPQLAYPLGHGAWLDDGRVVALARTGVGIVSGDGGPARALARSGQMAGYNPVMVAELPGSTWVLVQACPPGCPRSTVYAVALDGSAVRRVLDSARNPAWLPTGHLAYIADNGQLMLVPFDARAAAVRGDPRPVLDGVSSFSLSRAGDMVYREGNVGSAVR
ncbi:MAG TPA: protein kinase, partial [Gemmatimonadaceae bacterium]|nr:protein kinase [Gemmatimonadaceae bacterium]